MKKRLLLSTAILTLSMGLLIDTPNVNAEDYSNKTSTELQDDANNKKSKLSDIEKKRQKVEKEADDIKKKQLDLSKKIKNLSKDKENIEKRIDTRVTALSKQARSAQKEYKDKGLFDVILSSESISDAISQVSAINQLATANNEQVDELKQDKAKLDKTKVQLENDKRQLSKSMVDLETKKAELLSDETNTKNDLESIKKAQDAAKKSYTEANLVAPKSAPIVDEDDELDNMLIDTIETAKPETKTIEAPKNASALTAEAYKYIGVPYVWGGKDPSGFDCSGFTSYIYRQVTGKEIGGWTVPQENSGTHITLDQLQEGDLMFWGSPGATHHVALYIGNGQYIHAPTFGETVTVQSRSAWDGDFGVRPN